MRGAELLAHVKRDQNGVAHILGLSGGKDSTALALRMKELHRSVQGLLAVSGPELCDSCYDGD